MSDAKTTAVRNGVGAIAFWFLANFFTLVLNKYLYQSYDFRFPITLTIAHMLVSFILSILVLRIFRFISVIEVDVSKQIRTIIPVAGIFSVNTILGNYCLRWLPISFMQIIKATCPVFTALFQAMFLQQRFGTLTYLAVLMVVSGVAISSANEVNFHMWGFLAAMSSSVLHGAQVVWSGSVLQKMDPVNFLYRLAPFAALFMLPLALVFEYEGLVTWYYAQEKNEAMYMVLLSGVFAFALNCGSSLAIKMTSPLTMAVAGTIKVILNGLLTVRIFHNEVTWLSLVGSAIAVAGVSWYNWLRLQALNVATATKAR